MFEYIKYRTLEKNIRKTAINLRARGIAIKKRLQFLCLISFALRKTENHLSRKTRKMSETK